MSHSDSEIASKPFGDFNFWWQIEGDWVETPNQRRGGESGVIRYQHSDGKTYYIKRQINHVFRNLRYPLGRPTSLREAHAMRSFAAMGVTAPALIFSDCEKQQGNWRALLVTESLPKDYLDLDCYYQQNSPDAETQKAIIHAVATMLSTLHRNQWRHGGVYPKHVFIRLREADGKILADAALLDLERARHHWTITSASSKDLAQLKRRCKYWNAADWQEFLRCYKSLL
jgi:tRNA A-37 threonylcarbamoyl transferase component Bud32